MPEQFAELAGPVQKAATVEQWLWDAFKRSDIIKP